MNKPFDLSKNFPQRDVCMHVIYAYTYAYTYTYTYMHMHIHMHMHIRGMPAIFNM